MTERARTTIEVVPAGGVHLLELWNVGAIGRLTDQLGFALPPPGRSAGDARLRAIRIEPAAWLLDGSALDPPTIEAALGEDGALTAIGGGLVRVVVSGPGWRELLMADGVFDAENPAFKAGCAASTMIAHTPARLHVIDDATCEAFIPASYAADLIAGWGRIARDFG